MNTAKPPSRAKATMNLTVGLLSVPVKVYSGLQPVKVKRSRFAKESDSRIRQKYFREDTGEVVEWGEWDMKVQTASGWVVLSDDELAEFSLAKSRELEVVAFIDRDEAFATYVPTTLDQIRPADDSAAVAKVWTVIKAAMESTNTVGLVRWVTRGSNKVGLLDGNRLLEVAFANEVRAEREDVEGEANANEFAMAAKLVEAMTVESAPEVVDDVPVKVAAYVDDKADDAPVVVEDGSTVAAMMTSLEAALEAASANLDKAV